MSSSQPKSPPLLTPVAAATNASTVSPALSIFIAAFIAVFILLTFFFIYLRYCVGATPIVTPAAITLSRREPRTRGLDSALLQTFPTMVYADSKARHPPPECAVCLCEFEGRDILRLIPICSHVFHRDCIDVWLECHVSCPVCRRNLASDSSAAGVAVDREMELVDLVRIGSERRGVRMVSRGLQLSEDVGKKLGRSASLGVLPAGREKDGRVWFWRSLRLSGRERDVDGRSGVCPGDGDDLKAVCSRV